MTYRKYREYGHSKFIASVLVIPGPVLFAFAAIVGLIIGLAH
jgi:hypothetical protein